MIADHKNKRHLDEPVTLSIEVNRESRKPLHQQISEPIAEMIAGGELQPGQLLEDELALASRLHVSRPTIRRAFQDLVAGGMLSRRRGAGTRVTPVNFHRSVGLTSLFDDLARQGRHPTTDVLSYEVILADGASAELLGCQPGAELVRVRRLRRSEGAPLAIMRNTIPARTAPSLTTLASEGLYSALAVGGIVPSTAVQKVGAKGADAEEAALLDLEVGAPLVTMQRTAFGVDGEVIEYGDHVYDAAQYSVTFRLSAEHIPVP